MGEESVCSGDTGLIPRSGRSPGGRKATHPSIPAWKTPWTEEPGGVQSTGSKRVRLYWALVQNVARGVRGRKASLGTDHGSVKGKTRSDQACSLSLFLGKKKKKPTHSSFCLFTATIPVKRPRVIRHLGHQGMIWHFSPAACSFQREWEKDRRYALCVSAALFSRLI